MEALLRGWDGEDIILRFDRLSGAWIIIAIHSTRLGPGAGGTRMRRYPSLHAAINDALNLAGSMTLKFAVTGFPLGGAKCVIALPSDFDTGYKPDLLRRYGKLVRQLGGMYQTGPDLGTSPADMDIIAETGSPYVFCRTPEKGGSGDSGPSTALGVFSGMQAVCEQIFGDPSLSGKRVLVQGAGSAGAPLIDLLRKENAEVLFSDVDKATINRFRKDPGLTFVPAEKVYETSCDIFAPCALGGILNRRTVSKLKCRAVAGAANNQLAEPTVAKDLRDRGILYAPDYAINIGGAMAIIGLETMGWSRAEANEHIKSVRTGLRRIFELAAAEDISTDEAARKIAQARMSEIAGPPDRPAGNGRPTSE